MIRKEIDLTSSLKIFMAFSGRINYNRKVTLDRETKQSNTGKMEDE